MIAVWSFKNCIHIFFYGIFALFVSCFFMVCILVNGPIIYSGAHLKNLGIIHGLVFPVTFPRLINLSYQVKKSGTGGSLLELKYCSTSY